MGVSLADVNKSRPAPGAALTMRDAAVMLLGCFIFRTVNAFLVRTYFNADEYWQALEVAHRMVFGYGQGLNQGLTVIPLSAYVELACP